MNLDDTTKVLAKIQAYDRRTIGETDILAWHEILSDLEAADCFDAVAEHYRQETRWLMPADVRTHAKALAKRRAAAERRRLLEEAGWPPTEGTTATGPQAHDRSREVNAALRQFADRKAIDHSRLHPGHPDAVVALAAVARRLEPAP